MTNLLLAEHLRDDGTLQRTWLTPELRLVTDDMHDEEVPFDILVAVMERYGKPLDERGTEVTRLPLEGGAVLVHMRYLARYDVIAKDWLVLERPDHEPLCELSTTVSAALAHLTTALRRSSHCEQV